MKELLGSVVEGIVLKDSLATKDKTEDFEELLISLENFSKKDEEKKEGELVNYITKEKA